MKMQTHRPKEDPEINLISLIDIALLLVIFFMLSSTFMQEGRLKIELPQASLAPTGKQKTDPIIVSVTQSGSYRVNERESATMTAEALITTAGGLAVAIPSFIAYRYLRGKVERIVIDMEKIAVSFADSLGAERPDTTA